MRVVSSPGLYEAKVIVTRLTCSWLLCVSWLAHVLAKSSENRVGCLGSEREEEKTGKKENEKEENTN